MLEHPAHLLHEHLTRHWSAEHEAAQAGKATGERRWWAMAAIAPAILISAFDMTTLNVALPSLTRALRATTSDLQWIIDAYVIGLAGLLLFAQGVGDRFGRKGVYVSGLALFGLASASAAWATTSAQLILARAIMAIGAALLLSPTLAMICVIFSPEERPRAVASWVICGGTGLALGPILGGLIVDRFGWGGVFLINVPVVIATILLSILFLPTSRKPGDVRLDVVGAVLSVAGLATLLYGVIEGPNLGWSSPRTLVAIAAGTALTTAFFVWELRSDAPMFDPRVFTHPAVVAGATSLFVNYISLLGMLFLIPQYLQFVEGHSAFTTGLLLLPFGLTFMVAAQFVPKLTARFGPRTTIIAGMVAMAASFAILALIDGVASYGVTLLGTMASRSGRRRRSS
jgi:EmrB/QacA subfamily drug resistance transporter